MRKRDYATVVAKLIVEYDSDCKPTEDDLIEALIGQEGSPIVDIIEIIDTAAKTHAF